MSLRPILSFLLMSSLILLTCCTNTKEFFNSTSEINQLQRKLVTHFRETDINVNLHNAESLSVTYTNSPLNQSNRTERLKRAQETAHFIARHYPSVSRLRGIGVSFVLKQTRFLVVHHFESVDWFAFDKNGALIGPEYPTGVYESDDVRRADVRFSPQRNETDVQLTSVQLEGDLNRGLALVPHFTVPGDVFAASHQRVQPRSVGLEFASYSPKKVYSSDSRLLIKADGKVVYSGTARLMSASENNGTGTEFLSQQISYEQFRQMASAADVMIRLGLKEHRLTSDQLEGLRDMMKYAE